MPQKSGKNGKIGVGGSFIAGVRNIQYTFQSNNPQFATSSSAGHKTSVGGVKSGSGTGAIVLDTDDAIYDAVKPGDAVTLTVYEDDTRNWSIPARIDEISGEIDVDDGGELTVDFQWSARGAWTYPDGTQSS